MTCVSLRHSLAAGNSCCWRGGGCCCCNNTIAKGGTSEAGARDLRCVAARLAGAWVEVGWHLGCPERHGGLLLRCCRCRLGGSSSSDSSGPVAVLRLGLHMLGRPCVRTLSPCRALLDAAATGTHEESAWRDVGWRPVVRLLGAVRRINRR